MSMKMKKKKHLQLEKLNKWDYLLLVGISFIIMWVLGTLYMYTDSAKKNEVELVYEVMEQTAENQKNQFEKFIDDKVQLLQALVTYPEIYEMDTARQKEFIKDRARDLGFNHMFVVDKNGWGYYFEEDVIRDQRNDVFFQDIMGSDVFITQPFYTGTEVVVVTACVSIYDENGDKAGVLCGAINLESVQQMISKNEMILEGLSYILDEEGKYVTSQNHQDVYYMTSIYDNENAELSLIKESFQDKVDKTGTIVLNGITYQSHVTYLEDYKWVILQIIPEGKITERFVFLNRIQYALSFAVVALIGCLVRIIYLWRQSDKKIYTDPLTGCNSRAACIDLMDSLEHKKKEQIMIVYMDLNRFKWVNDTYGHEKGDYLLKLFADILQKTLGINGFVGRMGGDEFIAILLDTTEEELKKMWEQVESLLVSYSKKLDFPYQMSSSYGYAVRKRGEDILLNDLLQMADKAMYEYKIKQKEEE